MKPSMQNFLWQRSLRTVFTFPLVTLIVATVALTGYLSFRNGQDAVNDLVGQLHRTMIARIEQRLDGYLETPHLINQLNLDSIHMRMSDAPNTISLQSDFLSQLQRFPWVVSIAYADEQKGYVGPARKVLGAELVMVTSLENTNYIAETYSIDDQGNRLKLLRSNPEYDPRIRPWYQTAVQSGHETWVPIFLWTSGDVGLDLVAPVYDNEGKLLGVLDTSLTLKGIGEFLASMDVSPHGQSFIMERSGLLVASSTIREPYTVVGDDLIRLSARESKDQVVRSAALAVEQRPDNLTNFASSEQFEFDLDGERELLQVTPYRDEYGLDWLIVTIIPESDFTSQIHENNRSTILLIIASLLASILLATFMTDWVTPQTFRLWPCVRAVAAGDWSELVRVN